MKIEILYPELTNAYGDGINIKYLKEMFSKKEVILTSIDEEPYFVKHKVDLIYMGSHPDEYDDIILKSLKPYIKKLRELIEENTSVLFTGNAMELFGSFMEEKGIKKETLNLFPEFSFKRNKEARYNSMFLGTYGDIKIVGNQSQTSFMYGDNKYPFIEACEDCIGSNPDTKVEGIHYKNFYATYLLGPFLLLNPLFMKYLLGLSGYKKPLYLESQLMKTYENRLSFMETMEHKYIGPE